MTALLALLSEPGLSVKALTVAVGAGNTITVKALAEDLEAAGCVVVGRVPGPFGRQAAEIKLTPRGAKLARLLREGVAILPDDD